MNKHRLRSQMRDSKVQINNTTNSSEEKKTWNFTELKESIDPKLAINKELEKLKEGYSEEIRKLKEQHKEEKAMLEKEYKELAVEKFKIEQELKRMHDTNSVEINEDDLGSYDMLFFK